MAEKETSKVNNEETKQESTVRVGDRLTFVHELIEVLAGSIALIAPAILLILWLYRVGICGFYNLPIFYSSLNIIRFLPVIIFAVLSLMYSWFLDGVHFSDIISVKTTRVPKKNEKKQSHSMEKVKMLLAILLFLVCFILLYLILIAQVQEIISMSKGNYPYIIKDGVQLEALLVFVLVTFGIFVDIVFLSLVKKGSIDWDRIIKDEEFYASRRIKNLIIRISSPGTIPVTMKHFMNSGLAIHLILSGMVLILYIAVNISYFKTSYYMVNYDDTQYAIVLDTDDYYIGEPTQIIRHEDVRELIIHTNAYIYLDKAENPMVVRKESFDSITILRE